MKMNYRLGGALAAATMILASPAAARNVTADLDQIAEIMREEGLQAKIEVTDERRFIISGISGYNFDLYDYGCNDERKDCKWVQFRAAFAADTKPSVQEVNDFAAENFFGRFYVEKNGDAVIEMDVDLEAGGMSRELFVDNIAYWDSIMTKYADFVFSKDK